MNLYDRDVQAARNHTFLLLEQGYNDTQIQAKLIEVGFSQATTAQVVGEIFAEQTCGNSTKAILIAVGIASALLFLVVWLVNPGRSSLVSLFLMLKLLLIVIRVFTWLARTGNDL